MGISNNKKAAIDFKLFWPTIIVTLITCTIFVLFPEQSLSTLNTILSFLTGPLGWSYLWFCFIIFLLVVYLSFSKFGKIKLGNKDDKPEFSTATWLGLIFTASTGSSILYWGSIEWAYYFNGGSTPLGVPPGSWEASEWALAYGMFHEGLSAWSLYALAAVAIGYVYHVRKRPVLRISEACRCVLGDRADGILGKVIDICFIVGIIAGTATSMGFGTPMIAAGFSKLFGLEHTFELDLIIVGIWTVIISISLYSGLERGLKYLSNVNIYLLYFIIGFIFVAGPTAFILNHFSSAFGHMFQNFIRMSFWTDAVENSGFPQNWTIFYWAWWIVYAPQMGIFLAKISKGRTVKELLLGATLGGSIGCWLIYGALSSYGIYLDINNIIPVSEMIHNGKPAEAIAEIIYALPLGGFGLLLFSITALTYTATTSNAVAYSLAAVTTKQLPDGTHPARWNRIFWVLLLSGLATSLMYLGGLKPLQTASVVTALPLMFILGLLYYCFIKNLYEDGLMTKEIIISPGAVKQLK